MAYPQHFSGIPRRGFSSGGCGEPQIVGTRVTPRVPELQPAFDPDASGPTPMGEAGWRERIRGARGGD